VRLCLSLYFSLALGMQAVLDLQKNVLRIGDVETPFLGEADLPASARERPEEVAEAEHLANSAAANAAKRARDAPPVPASAPASASASAPVPVPVPASAPVPVAAAAAVPPAAAAVPPAAAASEFTEDAVQAVMGLGVSRAQALAALRAAGGNVDLAAGLLF
jgi:DNA damage-inducible protein 1